MVAWVRLNRKDVVEAVAAEVDKKFPTAARGKQSIKLPKSIENLK